MALVSRRFQNAAIDVLVERRCSDGYLNATAMCKAFGKLFAHYANTEGAKKFLDALAADLCRSSIGIAILDYNAVRASLVQSQNGGVRPGTWIHELVSIQLGQWLSAEFAVWVSRWILESARPGPSVAPKQLKPLLVIHPRPDGVEAAVEKMHAYAALVEGEGTVRDDGKIVIKIGCGNDPLKRGQAAHSEVKNRHNKDWRFTIFRIFQEVGQPMETLLHRKYNVQSFGQVGFSEYFWVDPDTFAEDVDEAFRQCTPELIQLQRRKKMEATATLKFDDLKRKRDEMELDCEIAERSLRRQQQEFELEKQRACLESEVAAKAMVTMAEAAVATAKLQAEALLIAARAKREATDLELFDEGRRSVKKSRATPVAAPHAAAAHSKSDESRKATTTLAPDAPVATSPAAAGWLRQHLTPSPDADGVKYIDVKRRFIADFRMKPATGLCLLKAAGLVPKNIKRVRRAVLGGQQLAWKPAAPL
jgi:hypothetical protein